MSDSTDVDAIRDVIGQYAEGMRTANTDVLREAFHPQSILCGYLGDELIAAPIEALFEWVGTNPPPDGFELTVLTVEITNRVASAKVRETDSHGTVVDYFHLLNTDGQWQIVSKLWDSA